jgi:hypothetical protein
LSKEYCRALENQSASYPTRGWEHLQNSQPLTSQLLYLTCPSSGSICQAFVQEFPCSAYDNTLVLIPKKGTEMELLYYVCALLRMEAWRSRYGRQITLFRLGDLKVDLSFYDKEAIAAFLDNLPFKR